MAYSYLRDFLRNYVDCNFSAPKSKFIQNLRSNRLNKFRYLQVNIPKVGETVEIPACMTGKVKSILEGQDMVLRTDVLSIPMTISNTYGDRIVHTYPNFMKNWFNHYIAGSAPTKIMLKEDVYYTYPGILMDADFNVLVYISASVMAVALDLNHSTIVRQKLNVYISPEIFTSGTTMNRNLIKKFIPEIISIRDEEAVRTGIEYTVTIQNMNHIIRDTVTPRTLDIDECVYESLELGIDAILENTEYV